MHDPSPFQPMKTSLVYGAISAVACAALYLIGYLLGYQTTNMAHGQWFSFLGFVVPLAVLFFGMREAREARPDKNAGYPYSKALVSAITISCFASLFFAIYVYIHYTFINPNFVQYFTEFSRSKMEAAGKLTPEQIDTAVRIQAKFMGPGIQAVFTLIFGPIFGTIEGLILAIFIKRPAPEGQVPSV